jgi:hypothetical protein
MEVRDGVLRQNGYKRESAVADAADAAMAVAQQVPGLDPFLSKPVLCCIGDHRLEGWARDVLLCTPQNLVAMLVSRPPMMDAPTVHRTLMYLQRALAAATSGMPRKSSRPKRWSRVPAARTRATSRSKKSGNARVSQLLGGLARGQTAGQRPGVRQD